MLANRQSRSGMTLIQVLVGLTIGLILLALTLCAVSLAREAANRVNCQSNQANFGKAAANYESINGQYPVFDWLESLRPHLGDGPAGPGAISIDPRLFVCPSDGQFVLPNAGLCTSYGFSSKLTTGIGAGGVTDGLSNTIMMSEARASRLKAALPSGPEFEGVDLRHAGHRFGANALFADGSVRFLPAERFAPEILAALFTPSGFEVVEMP